MRPFKLYVPLLAFVLLTACGPSPAILVKRAFQPGELLNLEWQATGNSQQLWLDVRAVGGLDLTGPVSVYAADQQIAHGTFSLEKKGMRENKGFHVQMWTTTPNGAGGQVHLFDLPKFPTGTGMKATIQLNPGPGVSVEQLTLQVRSRSTR